MSLSAFWSRPKKEANPAAPRHEKEGLVRDSSMISSSSWPLNSPYSSDSSHWRNFNPRCHGGHSLNPRCHGGHRWSKNKRIQVAVFYLWFGNCINRWLSPIRWLVAKVANIKPLPRERLQVWTWAKETSGPVDWTKASVFSVFLVLLSYWDKKIGSNIFEKILPFMIYSTCVQSGDIWATASSRSATWATPHRWSFPKGEDACHVAGRAIPR